MPCFGDGNSRHQGIDGSSRIDLRDRQQIRMSRESELDFVFGDRGLGEAHHLADSAIGF